MKPWMLTAVISMRWSLRQIAQEHRISRATVCRVVHEHASTAVNKGCHKRVRKTRPVTLTESMAGSPQSGRLKTYTFWKQGSDRRRTINHIVAPARSPFREIRSESCPFDLSPSELSKPHLKTEVLD
jgi:hypothetical protein